MPGNSIFVLHLLRLYFVNQSILLIYSPWTTFTKEDFEILSTKNSVEKKQFKPQKGLFKVGIEFLKQFIFLLFNIRKFDVVYIWFADYHSFLPTMFAKYFKKKSLLVIGGYDVAEFKELNYGSMTSPMRKWMTLYSFRNATLCIPVVEELEQKVLQICPKARTETIHTGYEFKLDGAVNLNTKRAKSILTVSITANYQRFMIKGLDRFSELATLLPQYTFIIIGIQESAKNLFKPKPENLILLPPVKQEKLTKYYLEASYYAQFSRSEGLPNAVCEAMVYGCIPLGVNAGGIGTAMGNFGLLVEEWNAQEVANFIKSSDSVVDRQSISDAIIHKFDLEKRVQKLNRVINKT